jgi:uncharacterized membrane protein YfcA
MTLLKTLTRFGGGGGGGAPAGPPLYILVNSFSPPDYPATTSAAYQTFTTVVTVDP